MDEVRMKFFDQVEIFLSASTWLSWTAAVAGSAAVAVALKCVLNWSSHHLPRWNAVAGQRADRIVTGLIQSTRAWVLFLWIFSAFLLLLDHAHRTDKAMHILLTIATCWQVALWGLRIADDWRLTALDRAKLSNASSAGAIGLMASVAKGVLLIVILLLGLGNAGVDVAALVASFGIGGLAVALASRNILEDLLASISILLDKPFEVNDFIIVGDKLGTVETIGVKTTRLRALSGEQLIFSNKDLLGSRIQNFKRMWQRRVVQGFSLPYDTPIETLARIPGWISELVRAEPKLNLDRCHLSGYQPTGIAFELVFFVLDPDYNVYMDVQQRLFLNIQRKFREQNVQFALPIQILRVQNGDAQPQKVDAGAPHERYPV